MADPADLGNDAAEYFLSVALANQQRTAIPEGVGLCINCGAALETASRWCDTACRDDYMQTVARSQ